MITRIWHGMVKSINAEKYLKYVEETGIQVYKEIKGNLSIKILRRFEGEICHFWTVTKWENID